MQVERRSSLPFPHFSEDLHWERDQGASVEDLTEIMDQLSNTGNGFFSAGEGRQIQRNNSGAYFAFVLEKALSGAQQGPESPRFAISPRAATAGYDAAGYDAAGYATTRYTPREYAAGKADADTAFAALSQKLSHFSSREGVDDRAKRELDQSAPFPSLQLGPEPPSAFAQDDRTSKRARVFHPGTRAEPDLFSLDDDNSVPRAVIEPKISRVNIDRIPAKEARRVLNSRRSAQKSYLRKKEKMKNMEEQLSKYEMQIECANRDLSRLKADYDKILKENFQLRGHSERQQSSPTRIQLSSPEADPSSHSAFW